MRRATESRLMWAALAAFVGWLLFHSDRPPSLPPDPPAVSHNGPASALMFPPHVPLAAARRRGLPRFEGASPHERRLVLAAMAEARPEARRLIRRIEGAVTFRVQTVDGAAAETAPARDGVEIWLDPRLFRRRGAAVAEVVVHELGHALQLTLVPTRLSFRLDAAIPPGFRCPNPGGHGCFVRPERFAVTFSRWALRRRRLVLGDYDVPAPRSLDAWGAPLAALAR